MKKTLFLSTLGVSIFLIGCGQSIPYINTDTEAKCVTINKNLLKIDSFAQAVEKTSAFHLEEVAIALQDPQISLSNNKRQMLRDAAKRKAQYESEHKKLGCEVATI